MGFSTASLADALVQFAKMTGISIAVDSALLTGKAAPALNGYWEPEEGLRRLLIGSGLHRVMEGDTAVVKKGEVATRAAGDENQTKILSTGDIQVRAKRFHEIGPLPGLGLTKEEIPGNVQSISAKDIKQAHSLSLTDLMNSKLQSVNVNDYQSNPFQMDVTYRGFTASPQLGTSQGLSVFLDGTRVNEPFGDVVNWDMIPLNALAGFDVIPGSNPVFGLGTLGGAISMKTKSGFDDTNVEMDILGGSFGRKQLQASGGWNNGTVAAFGAVNLFLEDGWRKNSPSKVNQAFGKVEWRNDKLSLSFSTLGVSNKLVGNGTVPQELYNEDPTAVFTSPDETRNRLLQFQVAGAFDVSDTFSITSQVYRRNSNRKSNTGDIIDVDTFRNLGYATRRAGSGETVTCALADDNKDGMPNYYTRAVTGDGAGNFPIDPTVLAYEQGSLDFSTISSTYNDPTVPSDFLSKLIQAQKPNAGQIITSTGDFIGSSYQTKSGQPPFLGANYYQDRNDPNVRHYILVASPINPQCLANIFSPKARLSSDGTRLYPLDANGDAIHVLRDGAIASGSNNFGTGTGYIEGTPTAIITKTNIDQTTTGGAIQLNWSLDHHKFMVGAALDHAQANYLATQRFGLLDANRNVYNDPSQIGAEYVAGSQDVPLNDFAGSSTTQSLYFSETWSPINTLNIAFSSRYNYSDLKNTLAPAKRGFNLANGYGINRYAWAVICPGTTLADCPFDVSSPLTPTQYAKYIDSLGSLTTLAPSHTEKFTYHSLNPALGITWQATPRLNLYGNLSQGTRLPSVIELGCAFDATPVLARSSDGNPLTDANGQQFYRARSVNDGRGCSLPSALSGDPYLPQVTAQTVEIGARGKFKELLEWNVSAYRTNLQDDIYMVAVTPDLSFFQDVGNTRRQGLEMGLNGEYGKSEFGLNYSLTEATFQSSFKMLSPSNSSTLSNDVRSANYNMIEVNPGDHLPGIPLDNLNLNWSYKLTSAFKVGFNLVVHSNTFLRGNENNKHTPGPGKGVITKVENANTGLSDYTLVATPDYNYDGKAPGFAVLNFKASYDLGWGWTASALVNNLLDKTYYSAGRLGITPFTSSINGAIGASGFNYNSSEWRTTQFMSPGAPRGLWLTLSYDFEASKKYDAPATTTMISPEPDRLLTAGHGPDVKELALQKQLSALSSLPVLNNPLAQTAAYAEQQVNLAIQNWQQSWRNNDINSYLQSYAPSFIPEGISRGDWEQQRKLQLATGAKPSSEIRHLVLAPQGNRMTAVFTQTLHQAQGDEVLEKMLYLAQYEGRWLIIREHTAVAPSPQTSAAIEATDQVVINRRHQHPLKMSLNEEAR